MGTSSNGHNSAARADRVKGFGKFGLHGRDGHKRLTLTSDLDSEPIPNELKRQFNVELIIPSNSTELPYLELRPVLDEDEAEMDNETLRRMWASVKMEGRR